MRSSEIRGHREGDIADAEALGTELGRTLRDRAGNFSSKEALLKEVITACVGEPFIDVENGSLADRRESFKQWLAMYISAYHRQNPAQGCVIPTLSADVARSKPEIREAYRHKMVDFIRKMSKVLDGAEPDREKHAWSIVAIMVGAIAISRAMPDGEEADKAIDSALQTAIALIG